MKERFGRDCNERFVDAEFRSLSNPLRTQAEQPRFRPGLIGSLLIDVDEFRIRSSCPPPLRAELSLCGSYERTSHVLLISEDEQG